MMVAGASFLTPGRQGTAAETPGNGRHGRVVMYVFDEAGLSLRDEHAAMVDQLNYSFALLKDGEATGSHWRQIRQVESYLRRHPHIDGVLSVGGWGAEGFSDACATAEGRQRLADSILRLMDAHGFVGVDIDWEYPGSSAAGTRRMWKTGMPCWRCCAKVWMHARRQRAVPIICPWRWAAAKRS